MELDFHPVSPEKYTITQATNEALEGEMWIGKGADGPPLHIHPRQTEHLELLEGKLTIYRKGHWETIGAGTAWVIPAGEVHTFKASPDCDARLWFRVTPGGEFIGFLRDTERLIQSGKLTSYESLNGLIYSSMLVKKYRNDFKAAQLPMRIVMALANATGTLMGRTV